MATIVIGSFMVRYPLGGNLSWALQYLVGFKELGHDVYLMEKYGYVNSCYDPIQQIESDDCTYGVKMVSELLGRYSLEKNWCYVANGDVYYGLSKKEVNDVFNRADLYIELGSHHSWAEEAEASGLTVFIDVDPAYTQINLHYAKEKKISIPSYDKYYTIGMNVGKAGNIIPTAGVQWGHLFNPVCTNLFQRKEPSPRAFYSTIMNWRSYNNVSYNGITYGQKDVEFEKIIPLPQRMNVPFEVAVAGLDDSKAEDLLGVGWTIDCAVRVTHNFDLFKEYISRCKGEFSVCKNVYTATCSGWFSDKSAAYMASGRPVVVQETGFSSYLPTGAGLFAFNTVDEAQKAIEEIEADYQKHSNAAFEIAKEYLEATKVLGKFLNELGL